LDKQHNQTFIISLHMYQLCF